MPLQGEEAASVYWLKNGDAKQVVQGRRCHSLHSAEFIIS